MVCTIILKKTSKATNRRRHHRRQYHRRRYTTTPQKTQCSPAAASSVLASINKTIFTCHRRLLGLFSHITSPDSYHRRQKGFKILKNKIDLESENLIFPPLIPLMGESEKKKTIVLDLDETLVHSTMQQPEGRYDFVVRPKIDGEDLTFFVIKRPGVDEFLEKIKEKFEVVVFTAGLREYASLVLDKLDPGRRVISHRLYRDACRDVEGRLVKDLGRVVKDMERVVIVDDNPNSYALQPDNALPIKPFLDDMKDEELKKLGEFFDGCDEVEDMRVAVRLFVGKETG